MYKHLYSRFLSEMGDRIHLAAHSHHLWPDVTRDAMIRCWDEAARFADGKWERVFEEVIPRAQRHVAGHLKTGTPDQIVFGSNTHEFVARVFSCFDPRRPIHVVSTTSEFHSFHRQLRRLIEAGWADAELIDPRPIETFVERFCRTIGDKQADLVFLSHVFFDTGYVVDDLGSVVETAAEAGAEVIIDGYHSFCALPLELSEVAQYAFITSGGYKYAQAGEGVCFLHVPPDCPLRPRNTGWFAGFRFLTDRSDRETFYEDDGRRFAGSTFDPAGLYRWNAVNDMLDAEGLTVAAIHDYVRNLQLAFVECIESIGHADLAPSRLLFDRERDHGHFVAFEMDSPAHAETVAARMVDAGLYVDQRGLHIRVGFGLYHDRSDIDEIGKRLRNLPATLS